MAAPRRAAIVGGNRIPFARSNSAYAQASNQDMLTATLDGLVARFGLAAIGTSGVGWDGRLAGTQSTRYCSLHESRGGETSVADQDRSQR